MKKSKATKQFSTAVLELREMYRRGVTSGAWKNREECARKVGIKPFQIKHLLNAESTDDKVSDAMQKMSAHMKTNQNHESDSNTGPPSFMSLFKKGRKMGLWRSSASCAKAIGIARGTLRGYLNGNVRQSPYAQTIYGKNLKKILSLVEKSPKGKPKAMPAPQPACDSVPVSSSDPLLSAIDTLANAIAQKVADQVGQRLAETSACRESIPAPEGVVTSNWVDDVIAGRRELSNQSLPNVRFVLTGKVFYKLLTSVTKEENDDTKELITRVLIPAITELRRRLTVCTQINADRSERSRYVKALGKELDELVIAIQQSRDVVLTGTALEYEEKRQKLDDLRCM